MNHNQKTAAAAVVLVGSGFVTGYLYAKREVTAVAETPRPAIQLDGGAVVLRKEPGAELTVPAPKLPSGSKVLRSGEVTVKPKPAEVKPDPVTGECPKLVECPAVTVRYDLVELHDGQPGMAITPQGGEIVDGVDAAGEPLLKWREPKWAVGVEWEPATGDLHAVVDREVGPLRVGARVAVKSEEPEGGLSLKFRF